MGENQLFARNAVIKSISEEEGDFVGKHIVLYNNDTKIAEGEVTNFRHGPSSGYVPTRDTYDQSVIRLRDNNGIEQDHPATTFTHIEFNPPLDESNEDDVGLLDDIIMCEEENVYYGGGKRRSTKTYKKKRTNKKSSKKSKKTRKPRKPRRKTSNKRR
jgi:hypothetical protein